MAVARRALLRLRAPRFQLPQRRQLSDAAGDGPLLQIYVSRNRDPYVNLSIEHHLLETSHPDSTILFLCRNHPCVVIGRNQNPWLETNLALLRHGVPERPPISAEQQHAPRRDPGPGRDEQQQQPPRKPVSLVRRRSGGGAVFHDEGNANWTVICPPAAFDRDRHAEMVVRALGRLGVAGVRVNGRHDIVQDVVVIGDGDEAEGTTTFKVSGSAYKLTRLRSLHHGTCLLESPNLQHISPLLRSPAEPFIKARGVASVRSKVRNVGVGYEDFVRGVTDEFQRMYGEVRGGGLTVGPEAAALPDVRKGIKELESREWIFGQTPLFTFSTHTTEDDPRQRPELPAFLPPNFRASLTARHGQIQEASLSSLTPRGANDRASQEQALSKALIGQTIHHIADWREALEKASPSPVESESVGGWLNGLFGTKACPPDE